MLRSLILVPAFLLAALGGCNSSRTEAPQEVRSAATGEPVTLAKGEEVEIAGYAVGFSDVVEDSRCPEDVTCVWEGRAKVSLSAHGPEGQAATQVLTLPYSGMTDDESSVWKIGGVNVELMDVLPMTGPESPREVTIRVTSGS